VRRAAAGAVLVLAIAAGAVAEAPPGSSPPRCFGAAARDAAHPCHNAALRTAVVPTPHAALRLPNAPCDFVRAGVPFVCAFGAPADRASRTVALLGDSHAVHWRAALGPVADAVGWHGVSLSRDGCPFSSARPVLPARLMPSCLRWRAAVPAWLRRHPEIDTLFVSAHPAHVVTARGRSPLATAVAGYIGAWRRLPRSIRTVVVIRDTPIDPPWTTGCIGRAIRTRRPAGLACAVPRHLALRGDAEAAAARAWHGRRRVVVIDFTDFMCDARRCFPVVGGALVHKDGNHLTATFGATLAPYLRRALVRLKV